MARLEVAQRLRGLLEHARIMRYHFFDEIVSRARDGAPRIVRVPEAASAARRGGA